jgi:hypothetical protein
VQELAADAFKSRTGTLLDQVADRVGKDRRRCTTQPPPNRTLPVMGGPMCGTSIGRRNGEYDLGLGSMAISPPNERCCPRCLEVMLLVRRIPPVDLLTAVLVFKCGECGREVTEEEPRPALADC